MNSFNLAFNFGGQEVNPINSVPSGGLSNLQTILSKFITIFILVGVFLLVIYIVWAGLQWITSGGDKQKVATARGRLTAAVIGLIIIMVAIFIVNAVGYFFKVNLLEIN